jgi:ABC-type Fe3+/spermidine/putrescine transport system ATPase subunit
MIELSCLSVRRGNDEVLSDVDLTIGAEVVALVGPSGSGKTTLLRVLLGLECPSNGRLLVNGRLLSDRARVLVPPEERNIAMVFQDLALWPHLTVSENLAFGLKARGIDKNSREQHIAAMLATVGLEAKASRSPHELSGGEKQRVAIARALVLDPVALLLDEPLGSLDVELKDELCGLFSRLLNERRVPTVYVTHDPQEAMRLARRIVVLESGRITQHGTPSELMNAPATNFVRAFVRLSDEHGPDGATMNNRVR